MRTQRGFTLIELMVGMVVGLLTTLVIAQVLAVAEGQRRTASVGASAQVNGAVALYGLQHDLQMAGYGISIVPAALGCPVRAAYNNVAPTATPFPLVPVVITANTTEGLPDTITLLSGTKTGPSVPALVTEDHPNAATSYVVQSSFSVSAGDLMVAVPGPATATSWSAASNWCTLFSVSSLTATNIGNATAAGWNNNQPTLTPATGFLGAGNFQSYLVNLGSMTLRTYSIASTGTLLQVADITGSAPAPTPTPLEAYADIVNIKGFYGLDTNADGAVDSFTCQTPTTNAVWQQVVAVRIAVVARSGQYEKDKVTASNPTLNVPMLATSSPSCSANPVTLKVDQLGADWQNYRYRVYDTVVPLRNVVWGS
ncbi:MAG: PilW family protein [Pseudomonadota bacterium]